MAVPLSTIKAALKIDYDDDDTELVRLRESAWSFIERDCQLVLTRQVRQMELDGFEDAMFPLHPFISVFGITYLLDGDVVTMAGSSYYVDKTSGPMPMLRFIDKPSRDPYTPVTVGYNVGYEMLPGEITQAVIALVGHWYNNPEASQPVGMSEVPMSLRWILDSLSVRSVYR